MKFENPSMHGSKDIACLKKCDERRDALMHGRTDNRNQYVPSTSSKLGA